MVTLSAGYRRVSARLLLLTWGVLIAPPAQAQVSDVPRLLTSSGRSVQAATQIGRRLFVGGTPSLGLAARRLLLVDSSGANPSALPDLDGSVLRAVSDGVGGFVVVGDFTHVGTIPQDRFAHFHADGSLDSGLRVTTDGPLADVAVAHGRIYLVGTFTTINGVPRAGFAALDAATGQVSSWGAAVHPGNVSGANLAVSSTAVYVRGDDGQVWGVDAGSGTVRFRRAINAGSVAATSQRLFVATSGAAGSAVTALDPVTGEDDATWTMPFGFRYIPANYGWDGTSVSLTVDDGRLLLAGRFDPDDNSFDNFAAIDTASGTRLPWPGVDGRSVQSLALVGDAIVLSLPSSGEVVLRSRTTGAPLAIVPPVQGQITSAVTTARGVVVVGSLTLGPPAAGGAVAAIDLDTGAIVADAAHDVPRSSRVDGLASDGTWLFVSAVLNGVPQLHKVDAATGASVATLPLPAGTVGQAMHLAGDRLFVAAGVNAQPTLWAIDTASWSTVPFPVTTDAHILALASSGDRLYLAGRFRSVNGVPRRGLAALDRVTGALLPWDPQADGNASSIVAEGTRVWASGEFSHIGGQARRGLAELDAVSAQAAAWDPDAPTGFRGFFSSGFVGPLTRASDGTLLVRVLGTPATVSGQVVDGFVAFAPDGRRLPWALGPSGVTGPLQLLATSDCVVEFRTSDGVFCHPMSIAPPASLTVTQAGAFTTLAWAAATGQAVTGWRLEVGTIERRSDVLVLDLPGTQTAISAPLPPGGYVARVRAITAAGISSATADVSFAAGQPAAPLDLTAHVAQRTATLRWSPPTTGMPASYYLDLGPTQGVGGSGRLVPGTATSVALDLAPGEYWGRLYAVTGGVPSRASADVRIDVAVTAPTCSAPPAPPINLRAQTSPGQVALLWDLAPEETLPVTWTLTAGSTPGGADVGTFPLRGTALGISAAVTRGTYFVRVTGSSLCGTGAASAELRVDVP